MYLTWLPVAMRQFQLKFAWHTTDTGTDINIVLHEYMPMYEPNTFYEAGASLSILNVWLLCVQMCHGGMGFRRVDT